MKTNQAATSMSKTFQCLRRVMARPFKVAGKMKCGAIVIACAVTASMLAFQATRGIGLSPARVAIMASINVLVCLLLVHRLALDPRRGGLRTDAPAIAVFAVVLGYAVSCLPS
jgi:hypothetical protein